MYTIVYMLKKCVCVCVCAGMSPQVACSLTLWRHTFLRMPFASSKYAKTPLATSPSLWRVKCTPQKHTHTPTTLMHSISPVAAWLKRENVHVLQPPRSASLPLLQSITLSQHIHSHNVFRSTPNTVGYWIKLIIWFRADSRVSRAFLLLFLKKTRVHSWLHIRTTTTWWILAVIVHNLILDFDSIITSNKFICRLYTKVLEWMFFLGPHTKY